VREDVLLQELAAQFPPAAAAMVAELCASEMMIIHDGHDCILGPA
jgi:hypothetical protein